LVRVSIPIGAVAAMALALSGAPAALADTSDSSNWAGYAAHRSGVSFHSVSALWRQPKVSCTRGHLTYSAVWVGLGGYTQSSNALEQIGTEVDCSRSGKAISSAWYELVPAPSVPIRLRVRPGDVVGATVTVTGHTVVVALADLTTRRTFSRTLHAQSVDVSSADWIVEAPSDCISDNSCQTLPLANFRTASFFFSQATADTGHTGAIADPSWNSTRIKLSPGGRRFVVAHGSGASVGAATPSGLTMNGKSFTVYYSRVSVQGNPFLSVRRPEIDGHLVHPAR
jgi:hypothetical protein